MSGVKDARFVRVLRDLFDDLSFAQVGAGALAAVTSMLLSSQIGIAGSVIGVAVGSVVSAVSSQVYKKMLAASADKLRDIPAVVGSPSAVRGSAAYAGTSGDDAKAPDALDGERGVFAASSAASASRAGAQTNPEATELLPPSVVCPNDVSAEAVLLRAHVERESRKRRRVVGVAVASSLAAVALTAAVVYGLTEGEGLGTKPDPMFSSASTDLTQSASDSEEALTGTPDGASEDADGASDTYGSAENGQDGSSKDSAQGSSSSANSHGNTGTNTGSNGSENSGNADNSGEAGNTGESENGGAGSTSGSPSGAGNGAQASVSTGIGATLAHFLTIS